MIHGTKHRTEVGITVSGRSWVGRRGACGMEAGDCRPRIAPSCGPRLRNPAPGTYFSNSERPAQRRGVWKERSRRGYSWLV
jgi:hypothetical protein